MAPNFTMNRAAHKSTDTLIEKALGALLLIMVGATALADEAAIDPTRPSGFSSPVGSSSKTQTDNALRLSLIRLGPQPLAIINGQSLRPGETIAGLRVQSIQPGHVVLSGNQGQRTLALLPSLRITAPSSTPILKRRPTL